MLPCHNFLFKSTYTKDFSVNTWVVIAKIRLDEQIKLKPVKATKQTLRTQVASTETLELVCWEFPFWSFPYQTPDEFFITGLQWCFLFFNIFFITWFKLFLPPLSSLVHVAVCSNQFLPAGVTVSLVNSLLIQGSAGHSVWFSNYLDLNGIQRQTFWADRWMWCVWEACKSLNQTPCLKAGTEWYYAQNTTRFQHGQRCHLWVYKELSFFSLAKFVPNSWTKTKFHFLAFASAVSPVALCIKLKRASHSEKYWGTFPSYILHYKFFIRFQTIVKVLWLKLKLSEKCKTELLGSCCHVGSYLVKTGMFYHSLKSSHGCWIIRRWLLVASQPLPH